MSWSDVESALHATNPLLLEGLRPPASRDALAWLEAAGVPEAWLSLWAEHDGQTHRIDGLFDGWTFLPVLDGADSVASVREALRAEGRSSLPVAIDHSGEALVLTDGRLHPTRGDGPRHDSARALLASTAARLRRTPPSLWTRQPDGRWTPSGEVEITVVDPDSIPVGEPHPIGHGLSWVRLDVTALATPWTRVIPFAQTSHDLLFAVDATESEAKGRLCRVWVRHGGKRARPLGTATQAGHHWVYGEDGDLSGIELVLTIDLEAPLGGPRPLHGARSTDPATRCTALQLLGDRTGALAAKRSAGARDAELLGLLYAAGETDSAEQLAEELDGADVEETRALWRARAGDLGGLDAWVASQRRAHASWLRARVREQAGDLAGVVADTRDAIQRLSFLERSSAERLRHLLDRRTSAQSAVPTQQAPVATVAELPPTVGAVTIEGADYRLTLQRTPSEAAAGGTVAVETPSGPVGVTLPPGAGDGATLRLKHIGPGGDGDLVVTVAIQLAPEWRPVEGCVNDTVTFERWDVVVAVPAENSGQPIQVASHDGVHQLQAPQSGEEVRVVGGGLIRPRGTPGALVIRTL